MEPGVSLRPDEARDGYSGGELAAAAVATFLFPPLTLLAALVLLVVQRDPRKRSQLRLWAWISVVWLALEMVAWLVLQTA